MNIAEKDVSRNLPIVPFQLAYVNFDMLKQKIIGWDLFKFTGAKNGQKLGLNSLLSNLETLFCHFEW